VLFFCARRGAGAFRAPRGGKDSPKGLHLFPRKRGRESGVRAATPKGVFSHVREYPPWTPKRTQGALPLAPAIASEQLEELQCLPNQVPALFYI